MKKILLDNVWTQSPTWKEVQFLLDQLNVGSTYFVRGSLDATENLNVLTTQHRRWINSVINLDEFPNCYILNGATEALNHWRLTDSRDWQFLNGDYQWPQLVSGNGFKTDIENLDSNKVLYITNPSCLDGNFLNPFFIEKINKAGCPVILDCAYLGATKINPVPVFKNTEQIIFSFSKGWGLIGQRAGLLYTKTFHPTLKHMKKVECWNYLTSEIISTIMNNFSLDSMHTLAHPIQSKICNNLNLSPSDTYFIANSSDPYFSKHQRVKGNARICLTPLWNQFDQPSH